MTVQLPLQEGILTLEQWQHAERLAASLSPEQARWISGYFAGLDAGLLRSGAVGIAPLFAPRARTLTILYGTETGNCRDLARGVAAEAGERGLAATVADMSDYKVRQLKDEQDILFVISTYGEGDPPQPSVGFFEFLEGPRAPKLEGVRYSVLALGNSTYEKFCEAGKRIDRRLEELGASRIAPRVDCDIDYEEPAAVWSAALADLLAENYGALSAAFVPATVGPASPAAAHDKRNPFAATVLENIRIVGRHSTKETRHVELDLSGSGLRYLPGNSLGLAASNNLQVVEELLDVAGLDGTTEVSVKGSLMLLASALTGRFEITTASPRLLEQWAKLSGASELESLLPASAAAERVKFLHDHHVVDILRRYPVPGVEAEQLLSSLRPLQPQTLFDRLKPGGRW